MPTEAAAEVLRSRLARAGIRATIGRTDGAYRLLVFADDLVPAKLVVREPRRIGRDPDHAVDLTGSDPVVAGVEEAEHAVAGQPERHHDQQVRPERLRGQRLERDVQARRPPSGRTASAAITTSIPISAMATPWR